MGKKEKKWKGNHATKVAKIPKTRRPKHGILNELLYIDDPVPLRYLDRLIF